MTRLVRAFPSTTFGLWRWTDAWETKWPDEALMWDHWAIEHASNPPLFHVRAAQLLFRRGDRAGALAELDAAAAKAHWTVKPTILRIRQQMETGPR